MNVFGLEVVFIVVFILLIVIFLLRIVINLVRELVGIGICWVVLFNLFLSVGNILLIVLVVLVVLGIIFLVVVCVWWKLFFGCGVFNVFWLLV